MSAMGVFLPPVHPIVIRGAWDELRHSNEYLQTWANW